MRSQQVDSSRSSAAVEPPTHTEVQPTSTRKRLWKRLEEKWNGIQVGHQGVYSVERLESFDYYCKTTSWTRVALVCVLTPIPALLAALLLECLPLQPPSEGWAANWMFWIRLTLTTAIMGFAGMSKLVTLVPDLNPTFSRRQLVTWGASAAYVGTALPAAIVIGFPVPLMWYLGGFFVGIHVQAMLLLVFGREPFMKTSACRPNLQRFVRCLAATMTLANIYPLYKVLYGFVPVQNRGIVAVLILPIWKLCAKHFIVKCTREMEDFVAQIVATTADFFSALFVSVCISTTTSMYLSMLFIAADIGQSLLEFWDIRVNANTVLRLLRRLKMSKSERFSRTPSTSNLVAWILAVTRDPTAFHINSLQGIRLGACYPHPMSAKQVQTLQVLEVSSVYIDASSQPPRLLPRAIRVAKAAIFPEHSNQVAVFTAETEATARAIKDEDRADHDSPDSLRHSPATAERSESLVRQGLQLLFHCEYLTLVEYVECIVPLIFVAYQSVLKQLPNAVYYPGRGDNWETGAMTNILVFAALEIASLLLLHFFLQCKFSFSPLYQLAFVLETQVYLVQADLFIGTLFLLQYELEHYGKQKTTCKAWHVHEINRYTIAPGIDFTFQFKWLHDSSP
ncbi:hypothetical protein JG687_00017810 [Phytophthora cactorum]|uniref:Uncharacterized protein n=1 Tax=Phytophthora cactorum TaxID=29920 RepID=A0A8T1TRH5_9STRA|nr:hypothetical protein JG687_00017810 [Phytophthora cactorum]